MRELIAHGIVVAMLFVICFALSACATVPVNRPCGVIVDGLRDVQGKTPQDTRRIDVHFERGVAAKCWGRT
jgi:starvation-inducible outer membrane lipoprotein